MEINLENFGGWAVGKNLYAYLLERLPAGLQILEFGSGSGSGELAKIWKIQCVEHDINFVNLYPNIEYIYAPIINGWYDTNSLKQIKPPDCIIIDGPPGYIGRHGILDYIDKIKNDCIIIFDDTHRKNDLAILEKLAKKLQRNIVIHTDNNKSFGVLL